MIYRDDTHRFAEKRNANFYEKKNLYAVEIKRSNSTHGQEPITNRLKC